MSLILKSVIVVDLNSEYNSKKVNILIECKSPNVKLNQKSIDQLVIYNMELKSKFLMLSNGLKHIFLKFNNNKFKIINSIPKYSDL